MRKNLQKTMIVLVLVFTSVTAMAMDLNKFFGYYKHDNMMLNCENVSYNIGVNKDTIPYYSITPYDDNSKESTSVLSSFYDMLDDDNGVLVLPDTVRVWHYIGFTNKLDDGFNMYVNSSKHPVRSITFPHQLWMIPNYAIQNAKYLTEVVFHEGIMIIGSGAFAGCRSLTSINLPTTVKKIGGYAFKNCTKLKEVTYGDKITKLPEGLFYGCGMDSVVIPATVDSVGDELFTNCKELRSITLMGTPPQMGANGYLGVSYKKVAVFVPEAYYEDYRNDEKWKKYNLRRIGEKYVYNSLITGHVDINVSEPGTLEAAVNALPREITDLKVTGNLNGDDIRTLRLMMNLPTYSDESVPEIHPDSLLKYLDLSEANIVAGGGFYKSTYAGEGKPYRESYTENNVLGECMFEKASTIKNLVLPESLTAIDSCALSYCNNLQKITIPKKVKRLERNALSYCNFKSVSMGNPEMGDKAFYNCHVIAEIFVDSKTAPACVDESSETYANMFSITPRSKCTVYVPVGSAATYKASNLWKDFNIVESSELTDVTTVKVTTPSAQNLLYDLQGRRITNTQKGLNIKNGKVIHIE